MLMPPAWRHSGCSRVCMQPPLVQCEEVGTASTDVDAARNEKLRAQMLGEGVATSNLQYGYLPAARQRPASETKCTCTHSHTKQCRTTAQ